MDEISPYPEAAHVPPFAVTRNHISSGGRLGGSAGGGGTRGGGRGGMGGDGGNDGGGSRGGEGNSKQCMLRVIGNKVVPSEYTQPVVPTGVVESAEIAFAFVLVEV